MAGRLVGGEMNFDRITEAPVVVRNGSQLFDQPDASERMKEIINTIEAIVWEADATTLRFSFVSEQAKTLLGYPVRRWLEDPDFWQDHVHPDDLAATLKVSAQATAALSSHVVEYRMFAADGREVWLRDSIRVISHEGKAVTLRGIMMDVTEMKQATARLRAHRAEMQLLLDLIPAKVLFKDTKNRLIRVNRKVAESAGRPVEELEGKSCEELFPEEAARYFAGDLAVIKTGEAQLDVVERLVDAEGVEQWIQTDKIPHRDPSGQINGVVVMVQDITKQRRAEEAQRLQADMLDQIGQAVIATDMAGKVTYANRVAGELYGWMSLAEMRGTDMLDATVAKPSEAQAAEIMARLAKGEKWSGEFLCRRRNGSEFEAFVTNSPLLNEAGKLLGIVGISFDITQRKQAERALQQGEANLQNAQRIAHLGSWECDVATGNIQWSAEVYRIFGLSPEGLSPTLETFFDAVHPSDRKRVRAAYDQALVGGPPYTVEHRVVRPDGTERIVHEQAEVSFDASGQAVRMAGTVQDITERTRAAALLLDSQQRLTLATESARIGIWDWDLGTNKLVWDEHMCALYGIRRQNFSGAFDTWQKSLHPDDRARAEGEIMAAVHGLNGFHTEFRVLWPNGEVRHIEAHASVRNAGDGLPAHMVGVNWDITKRKKAEATLRKREADLAKAQRIAHLGSWEWNLVSGNAVWSTEFYEIFGFSSPDSKAGYANGEAHTQAQWAEAFANAIHPEDRRFVLDAIDHSLATGEPYSIDYRIHRSDGTELVVHGTAEVTRDESGKALLISGIVQDVTARKKRETELREAEEKYRTIFENASEGIFRTTREGKILVVNPAAARLLGFESPADLMAMRSDMARQGYVDPQRRQQFKELIENDGAVAGFESEVYRKDGSRICISETARIVRDSAGAILYFEGTFEDITERKRAEEVLSGSERRLRFLNDLADATRFLSQPREIMAAVARLLGTHLNVTRCAYGEMEDDGNHFTIPGDYADGCVSLVGQYELADFGQQTYSVLAAGQILILHDVESDLTSEEEKNAYLAFDIRSTLARPLMKNSRLIGILAVHDRVPRPWTQSEIELVEEVAERCWSIIERARAELVLRGSEEHLNFVIAASNDGIFEHDFVTDTIVWSDRLYQMFGLERESFTPTLEGFIELLHPEDRAAFQKAVAEQMASGGRYDAHTRVRRGDGSYGDFLARGRVAHDASGKPTRIIGSVADVTSLFRAEQRLKEQAALLDLAHDAIMVRSMEDEVLYWNYGAETLYGWTAAEAIGRRASGFLHTDGPASDAARRTLLERGQWTGECKHLRKDGTPVLTRSRWTLVRDEKGQPKSILIINTDITEQKKVEEQFLRAQRLESIGTLASGVAHDLNNILAPILMSAPLLHSDLSPETREKIVSTIEQSAERGAQIVNQVLTFARGVEGERILIDPSHLVKEMVNIAQQTFPKSIRVVSRYPENLWLVEGDPTQLHQVLLNLSVNARDAMPTGGNLLLAAENFEVDDHYASMMPDAKRGLYVLLTASDSGSGMRRELIDKIFVPFFTTKEVGVGTGLGLSTVLGIVKSHGGFIVVESEPGNGTTFKIFLPACGGTPPAKEPIQALPDGNQETILVVDDEPAILEVTKLILESHNYKVLGASDGPEALAIFAQQMESIDVVITDLLMPFMDGVAVVRSMKKMKPNVCIVASTGQDERARLSELEGLGVKASLPKPYNGAKLLKMIHEVVSSEACQSAGHIL